MPLGGTCSEGTRPQPGANGAHAAFEHSQYSVYHLPLAHFELLAHAAGTNLAWPRYLLLICGILDAALVHGCQG